MCDVSLKRKEKMKGEKEKRWSLRFMCLLFAVVDFSKNLLVVN